MPFYYDVSLPITTNAGAGTQSTGPHLTVKTVANQPVAMIKGCYAGARSGTAGGGEIRAISYGTATSTSGTNFTPNKRHPNSPAALSSWLSSQTGPGATPATRFSVGFAQTGGMGGWVAIEPDAALQLLPNGGATGNLDINSISNAASVAVDLTVEFSE